jgi:hypothetical protein
VLAREAVSLADTTDFLNLQAGTLEVLAQIEPASGALDAAGRLYERKGNLAALTRLGPSRPSPG